MLEITNVAKGFTKKNEEEVDGVETKLVHPFAGLTDSEIHFYIYCNIF